MEKLSNVSKLNRSSQILAKFQRQRHLEIEKRGSIKFNMIIMFYFLSTFQWCRQTQRWSQTNVVQQTTQS